MTTTTNDAIEHVQQSLSLVDALLLQASEKGQPVERVDLADIRSDLATALEKLQAVQQYQLSPQTDYAELWACKQQELLEFERARDAWVRTEIFSMLLTPHCDLCLNV